MATLLFVSKPTNGDSMKSLLVSFLLLTSISAFANCDVENIISKSSFPNTNFKVFVMTTKTGQNIYNQVIPLNEETRTTLEEASMKSNVTVCLRGTRFDRTIYAYSASY